MKFSQLGSTDIKVSKICLGTMTYGEQNSIIEAHGQLDYAYERGVNFIDTAEMYPVPPCAETYTATEEFIGKWPKLKSCRENLVIATKVSGPMPGFDHIRSGNSRFNKETLIEAIDNSLLRLRVNYIDLYQLHWPERSTNYFGQLDYTFDEEKDKGSTAIDEVLEALEELRKTGKVKEFGVSNESPWGLMKFLEFSKRKKLPKIQTIQNPYSLLNRSFEIGLSEICHREKVGLLAYSPLGFGVLSGKYLNGKRPKGARLSLWDRFSRYTNKEGIEATAKYVKLAQSHNLSPAQMALAFVNQKFFVCSNIIGATKMKQLKENIDSINIELSSELMSEIEEIHKQNSNPCP